MNNAKYIALDCETGGLIPKTASLLTMYLQVLDKDLNPLDSLYLRVKPNDGVYQTTGESLSINKIDLVEHDKIAIIYSKAGQELRDFLIKHSDSGKIKLIPVGHNVPFDLEFLYELLLNKKEAQKYVSYRILDTSASTQFLKSCGLIPESVSGSLKSLVEYFQIPGPETHGGKFHTADQDVFMTVQVLKHLISLVNN